MRVCVGGWEKERKKEKTVITETKEQIYIYIYISGESQAVHRNLVNRTRLVETSQPWHVGGVCVCVRCLFIMCQENMGQASACL